MFVPANKHGNTAPHDVKPCLLLLSHATALAADGTLLRETPWKWAF